MNLDIPSIQKAVQLTGPDELRLNAEKQVHMPGPYQILCEVEAVGLCFSDLKLLKQFSNHARKGPIKQGIDPAILDEVPSYIPNNKPGVPGHEAVVRVCAIGDKVEGIKQGGRYLVQTDYRWLPNTNSNASFGYNFEGGLQQYVLMDQRVITSPEGESMLIQASGSLSASAIALIEPWACVECAFAVKERVKITNDGRMLIVIDKSCDPAKLESLFNNYGTPAKVTLVSEHTVNLNIDLSVENTNSLSELSGATFDDVIYFGNCPETVELLLLKVGPKGLINIVLCGSKLDRKVVAHLGRVHYGGIRIIGTAGSDPADAMKNIPTTAELQKGDKINIIGATGSMGLMHVIRCISQGIKDVMVYAGGRNQKRLDAVSEIASPIARKLSIHYLPYNIKHGMPKVKFDYIMLLASAVKLLTESVEQAAQNGIINVFAGINADVEVAIDLDQYIRKQLYFVGTSGSRLEDMEVVLEKVESGKLDTNISVAAVCGIENAVDGIRAVENHSISGKIIVYPSVSGLPLLTLDKLQQSMPEVAKKLSEGLWTKDAEDVLLNKGN